MRHLELFAGIGGFRRALDLIQQDLHIPMECVGFSEIDARAVQTYTTNYQPAEHEALGDIVTLTNDQIRLQNIPNFDILTGGFPCQTFSLMGEQTGFGEDRGQMFFRILDILETKRANNHLPRYILLENVKNLLRHDNGRTYTRIRAELTRLGYDVVETILNTKDFALPQKRSRLIIFASLEPIPNEIKTDITNNGIQTYYEHLPNGDSTFKYDTVNDILAQEVEAKYYLSARVKPTIISDGTGGYHSNSKINLPIARTLTASMHKMHRACQDNYYSDAYIASYGANDDSDGLTKEQICELNIRKLTPEEAFMLQGFPAEFATNARLNGVSNGALYKQAGNAVSVNVIYAVFRYLIDNNLIVE